MTTETRMRRMRRVGDWVSGQVFRLVHSRNLVYNACWEDPRLDREALELGPQDRVLVITSAGCNALDYALDAPQAVLAADMNFRQNALLELKQAGIRALDHADFFALYGRGRLRGFRSVYLEALRPQLAPAARRYWDRRQAFFSGRGWRGSFYYRGTSGAFARAVKAYVSRKPGLRQGLDDLFAAPTVAEQAAIYERLRPVFWTRLVRWLVRRDATLALLGVPRAQRVQVERGYPGGIAQFIDDALTSVFARLPLKDNYFWRLYVYGEYTPDCCPEYLKPAGFAALKAGLVDRVSTHTGTVESLLRREGPPISRFVLLDHMDWLSAPERLPILRNEWQALVERAAPNARILWRSGGLQCDYVDPLEIDVGGRRRRLGELLEYRTELAQRLHAQDRVHTYGNFHIADLRLDR